MTLRRLLLSILIYSAFITPTIEASDEETDGGEPEEEDMLIPKGVLKMEPKLNIEEGLQLHNELRRQEEEASDMLKMVRVIIIISVA